MKITEYYEIFIYVLRREWVFLLHLRRKFLIFMLVMPVAMLLLLIAIFNEPTITKVPIAVLDNDNTHTSRELTRMLNSSPYLDVAYEVADSLEAERLMKRTDIFGYVIIPHDFTKKVLGYKGAKVPLYYNNQFITVGGMVKKGVIATVQGFSARYDKLFAISSGVPVYASNVSASPIVFNEHVLFNPYINYQYFMLLGLFPALMQLFINGSFVYAYGFEFKSKRAKDLVDKINVAPFTVMFAKSVPYLIIFSANCVIMVYLQFVYLGTPLMAERGLILLSTILFILASSSVGVFIISLAFGNLRMALSGAAIYAAPAFAYAGVAFPLPAMPALAKVWANLLPVTHYHTILVNEAIRGATHSSTPFQLLFLFLFASVCFVLNTILYKHWVNTPKSWGKL